MGNLQSGTSVKTEKTVEPKKARKPLPLFVRVLIGVALGALLGLLFGERRYLLGLLRN